MSKKPKLSSQKGAFASIFKKANQGEICKTSPGRHKASAKVTAKTGNFTCILGWPGTKEVGVIGINSTARLVDMKSYNNAC